jgi:hypothetical protein
MSRLRELCDFVSILNGCGAHRHGIWVPGWDRIPGAALVVWG